MTTNAVIVQEVIDRARSRHWAFSEGNDGAALHFLNERLRATLLAIIKTVEEQIGETSQIDVTGTATLIAVDDNMVPYFTTTTEPGYAIRFAGGVPYVDVSDPFVSDPFGLNGDVPGLPLPEDLLRITSVSAMTLDNDIVPRPIDVLPQELAQKPPVRVGLRAFVSANRLIPIRSDASDVWSRVTSIRLGFVRCQELATTQDAIILPTPCVHALTAQLCHFFALGSKTCPQQDKTRFEKQADQATDELLANVNSLEGITTSTVIFKR